MKKQLIALLLSLFIIPIFTPIFASIPVSKEATIIEIASSSEVYIKGVGIFSSKEKRRRKRRTEVKKYGVQYASLDAKKAAVYYLLFNGTDPLLSRPDEINRFTAIQDAFFSEENINEIVVYSEPKPHQIISLRKGEAVKVLLNMKINLNFLRQILEENLVIFSRDELVEYLGYPNIMVVPVVENSENPVEVLKKDPQKKHAAAVIESYLTAKQFDVIIPDQLETINQLVESISEIKELSPDPVYTLALNIGSDIYIDYSIGQSKAAYDTDQMAVTVRAYETTTGRLLATETGYSKSRVGELYVSIEEALLSALNIVSSRLLKYWEDDLYRGIQYKVITKIDPTNMTEEKHEDVLDDILDSLEAVSQSVKENSLSDKTLDITLWCNHENIQSSRNLYRAIRDEFSQKQKNIKIKLVNRNRKLLLLSVE